MKKLIPLIGILVIALTMSGCSAKEYEVSYILESGATAVKVIVASDDTLDEPFAPVLLGYEFGGWYNENTFIELYDFNNIVTKDFTLYAKWTVVIVAEIDIPEEGVIDLTSLPYYSYLDSSNPVVTITIAGIGEMKLELFGAVAPNTVNNFINYILDNDYIGSTFHRVIEDFMIQGGMVNSSNCVINGDFNNNGFTNDLSHDRGVISMARTNIMNSATSQFFIVHQDSYFLDGAYATFGGLISGFNVLDYIALVATNYSDAPLTSITIESITIELNGYVAQDPVCAN
ncbi:MAG: peptidylprolyl isomerase [Candidatus Izemoplasma sp.]